jgi:hypothetical protein
VFKFRILGKFSLFLNLYLKCQNLQKELHLGWHGIELRYPGLGKHSITSANQATEIGQILLKAHKILLSKRVKTFERTFSCHISENEE